MERCPGCFKNPQKSTKQRNKSTSRNQKPEFRCRDCHGGLVYCRTCIVARHLENPLHRIYHWNGDFFERTTLAKLGLRVQLGHSPFKRCTAPKPSKKGFVTLHSNGIHEVEVDFCGCEGAAAAGTPDIQLLRAGWFPATHDRPHTAATFAVLDQFQQVTCQAKTTMYDFYHTLEKLTSNAGDILPDRYHEFIRMCREFEHLLLLLFGRRSTAFDASGAEGTEAGGLAVECPACPRPGVNLMEDWINTPPEKRHLITLYIGLDACFRLKRRLISSELKDPGLGTGWAYMVENEPYREYLRTMTTCSGLAALDYANTKFSRGYATTGVGMGVCVRHEFVQPNGVGDLQRGERFANMDYIVGSILRHKDDRLFKLISYDIVCIWSKYFKERMANLPPLVRLNVVLFFFKFVIPKLHILAHTWLCQILFSLNLIPGSGQTDGEGIERPWAAIGGVAMSTGDMGPGARHGTLDFQWSSWNWVKLVGLVASLRRRRDNALQEQAEQRQIFEEFSREQADRVPAWKKMVDDFENDPTVKNPYEVKVAGLSEAKVRLQFAEEESAAAKRGVPALHDVSPSKFITLGLDLEDEQRRIRVQAILKKANTTAMQIDLKTMRTKLNRRVLQFRKLQATYTPAALQILGDQRIPEDILVENMPLVLPSAMPAEARAAGCTPGLPDIEALMRHAQCRGALSSLRNQLHIKSRLMIYKKDQVRAQGASTRSQTIVARNESKIGLHSEKYQMAWDAIRLLGDGDPDPENVGWKMLRKEDIRCMQDMEDVEKKAKRREAQEERRRRRNADLLAHGILPAEMDPGMVVDDNEFERVPEDRRKMSWIWAIAGTTGTDAGFEDDPTALRIEWSKAYARTRCWDEEVELLEEEYRRVGVSFEHEARRWDTRATAVRVDIDKAEGEGARAFAKRQAAMFRALIERGKLTLTWTEEKLPNGKKRRRPQDQGSARTDAIDEGEAAGDEDINEELEVELSRGDVEGAEEEYILSGVVEDE
ncbi:hypothetical protein C8R46DRAFT_910450 [Mycena filopes]|nr:hypothetical protein C8R46DRAFT_910450 [Mycena filopes]